MSAPTVTRPLPRTLRWHAWFAMYAALGALTVLGLTSIGWIVLGPAILAVLACSWVPTVRGSACGLAVGAGFVFVYLALPVGDHSYAGPLLGMGVPLVVAGVLEWVRHMWFAPAP